MYLHHRDDVSASPHMVPYRRAQAGPWVTDYVDTIASVTGRIMTPPWACRRTQCVSDSTVRLPQA